MFWALTMRCRVTMAEGQESISSLPGKTMLGMQKRLTRRYETDYRWNSAGIQQVFRMAASIRQRRRSPGQLTSVKYEC